MLNYLFVAIIFIHGIIHLVGYSKSFHYSELKHITVPVSKPLGLLWITVCVLFIVTAILFLLRIEFWWIIAINTVILSQAVIFVSWKDAKYGTIANTLILIFIVWKIFI